MVKRGFATIVILTTLIMSGCSSEGEKQEVIKKKSNETANNTINVTDKGNTSEDFIISGCDDSVCIRGSDLIEQGEKKSTFAISDTCKVNVCLKSDNENGMSVYICEEGSDTVYWDLQKDFDVDSSITDESGLPLEHMKYEVSCYDFNLDERKEIVYSVSDNKRIKSYVFSVKLKAYKINQVVEIRKIKETNFEGKQVNVEKLSKRYDASNNQVDFWTDGNEIDVDITYDDLEHEHWRDTKGVAKVKRVDQNNNTQLWAIEVEAQDKKLKKRNLYFYVDDDKIYSIDEIQGKPDYDDTQLVYQKEETYHEQDEEHYMYGIKHIKQYTRFYMCNTLVETGYYKVIVFGQDRSIIFHETGYGAGREIVRIEFYW